MKRVLLSVIIAIVLMLPAAVQAVGDAGHCIDFAGAGPGNSVIVPYNAALNTVNTNYTIEAWIKWEGATLPSGSWRIVDRQGYFALYIAPNASYGAFRLWFLAYPLGSGSVAVASVINVSNLNAWHHVAVAVQPSGASYAAVLYIDGVQAGSATNAAFGLLNPANTDRNFNIGVSWANSGFFNGLIDEVRVWSIRRSASQISNNRGVPMAGSESSLKFLWKLNDGSGALATESANGLHGNVSATNAAWVVSTAPIGYNLLQPNSGTYTWATNVNLQWSVNPLITNVDLYRSPDGGATWQPIALNLANPANAIGSQNDLVPIIETTTARYRVNKAGDAAQFDASDNPIAWTGAGFVPVVTEYEAELAALSKNMFAGVNGKAFGCQFIYSSKNTGGGEGTGSIPINVANAGTYFIWARMLGYGETRNSIFVRIDDGPEFVLEVPADIRWHWTQAMSSRGSAVPAAFAITAGAHTLHLRGRERFAHVDRVAITNDPRPNFYQPEPNKWIQITQPMVADNPVNLVRSSLYEIKWESRNVGAFVNLEYSLDAGATFSSIQKQAENDGSLMWQVPDTLVDHAKVRIYETGTTCPMDENFQVFSITNPPPQITVTAPNGGETLVARDTTEITWTSGWYNGNVSVFCSYDNGANWLQIADNIPDIGKFHWVIPKTLSDSCLIKVADAATGSPADVSDSLFAIVRPADEFPGITITAPNGGEIWEVGQTEMIRWNSQYFGTSVDLFFSNDSGLTWTPVATGLPVEGEYAWVIPDAPSKKCFIKVVETLSGIPVDLNDAVFEITDLPENYALMFDGVDDLVQVPNHASLNVSKSMTIEFWMRTDKLSQGWGRLIEKGTFDEYSLTFYGDTGRLSGSMRTAIPGGSRWSNVFGPTTSLLSTDAWVHVAATYDGVSAKMYINGELESTQDVKTAPRNLLGDLIIGGALHGTIYEYHYSGLIDELRIWNIPRTLEEITDNMFMRLKFDTPGLVAYYTFDEGAGQVANDATPLLNNGRLGKSVDPDDADPLWYACERPVAMNAVARLTKAPLSVEELTELEPVPDQFTLSQNYPNPFNATTTIAYLVPAGSAGNQVRLDIYDVKGRLIKTLANSPAEAGSHRVIWDGYDNSGQPVTSGLYFYRLQAGSFTEVKRLVMLK